MKQENAFTINDFLNGFSTTEEDKKEAWMREKYPGLFPKRKWKEDKKSDLSTP